MEFCRVTWPKLSLRFSTGDSLQVKARIEAGQLDMGLEFEHEFTPGLLRQALFRHRLDLVRRRAEGLVMASITLPELAKLPLILPSHPNVTRSLLEPAFLLAGVQPTIAAEADVLSSMLSAVRMGLGGTIIPKGNLSDVPGHADLIAVPIEPPLHSRLPPMRRAPVPRPPCGLCLPSSSRRASSKPLLRAQSGLARSGPYRARISRSARASAW
jgi:LysR family nitrogen assimilation transcriptional regulator